MVTFASMHSAGEHASLLIMAADGGSRACFPIRVKRHQIIISHVL